MPFVMGVLACHLDEVLSMPLEEVVLVHLDHDTVQTSAKGSS